MILFLNLLFGRLVMSLLWSFCRRMPGLLLVGSWGDHAPVEREFTFLSWQFSEEMCFSCDILCSDEILVTDCELFHCLKP